MLAILGFIHITQPVSTLWTATTTGGSGVRVPVGFGAVVAAMTTAIFALNGYGTAVYYAEETKQATKTIGRAILWSLVIVVVVELVPLIAVLLGTPSMSGLVGAADPMSYFLQARGGTVVNDLVSLGIAIAIINAVLAIVLQAGRLVYSSARDRSWPDWLNRPFAAVHPRLRTPVVATLVVGVASALVLWLMPFNIMLTATGATVIITYLLVGLAAFVGRVTGRSGGADYKMPWWPLVTLVMIAATAVVTYETWLVDWVPVIVAIGMFLVGIPYYYLYLHPRRGDRWTLPDAPDEEIEG